eukprot:195867-Hanusia_phi.AAC.1
MVCAGPAGGVCAVAPGGGAAGGAGHGRADGGVADAVGPCGGGGRGADPEPDAPDGIGAGAAGVPPDGGGREDGAGGGAGVPGAGDQRHAHRPHAVAGAAERGGQPAAELGRGLRPAWGPGSLLEALRELRVLRRVLLRAGWGRRAWGRRAWGGNGQGRRAWGGNGQGRGKQGSPAGGRPPHRCGPRQAGVPGGGPWGLTAVGHGPRAHHGRLLLHVQ